jgi:ComF family protein
VFRYRFPVDQLLHRYKYSAQIPLAGFFCDSFKALIAERERPDLVVAVPLSRERLAERGFNQAALLAEGVAKYWKVRADRRSLRRIRHTQPQAELQLASRQANVKDAFVCDRDLAGKHVALFDDVMTTGSTLNEAAKALKRRGASRVTAWVVARAEKHEAAAAAARECDV